MALQLNPVIKDYKEWAWNTYHRYQGVKFETRERTKLDFIRINQSHLKYQI
jgi:hypothetical protein